MSEENEEAQWIKIKSNDGFEFLIPRKAAKCSGFLREMLDSGFMEATANAVSLDLRAIVTEKIMEYLVFKAQYEKATSKEEVPDFGERIVPELALETLMAADYMQT